jgi:hypothetical protein
MTTHLACGATRHDVAIHRSSHLCLPLYLLLCAAAGECGTCMKQLLEFAFLTMASYVSLHL